MIGRLIGDFAGLTPDGAALIDVSGVGYVVRMPSLVGLPAQAGALPSSPDGRVCLYINTIVREDALDLYGFLSEEELVFFKQLMGVSGVGPKTALGIMGVAAVSALKRAIAQSDTVTLIKVYGIGKKSAERLVLELRDKIKFDGARPGEAGHDDSEVLEALMAMGYRSDESRKIVQDIPAHIQGVNERLAAALRQLGS